MTSNQKVSKYFWLSEFTANRHGISNLPNDKELSNIKSLCLSLLDAIREGLGVAVNITSGFRCEALNRKVGGVQNSQHRKGMAADLKVKGLTQEVLFKNIVNVIKSAELQFDQLIWEKDSNCVHISYNKDSNRNEILLRDKRDGKYYYEKYVA